MQKHEKLKKNLFTIFILIILLIIFSENNTSLLTFSDDNSTNSNEEVDSSLEFNYGFDQEEYTKYYVSEVEGKILSNSENIILFDEFENQIVLPANFFVSLDSGKSIAEGIVIEDENQNQFIWIPVNDYLLTLEGQSSISYDKYYIDDKGYITSVINDNFVGKSSLIYGNEELEYNITSIDTHNLELKESVEKYGGYYVSRYNARGNNTSNLKNFEYYIESNDFYFFENFEKITNITNNEARELASNYYETNPYFTTGLLNGYAYDTMIIYIDQYSNKDDTNLKTYLNIYDFENEWTSETLYFENEDEIKKFFSRRTWLYREGFEEDETTSSTGFRMMLYLK